MIQNNGCVHSHFITEIAAQAIPTKSARPNPHKNSPPTALSSSDGSLDRVGSGHLLMSGATSLDRALSMASFASRNQASLMRKLYAYTNWSSS